MSGVAPRWRCWVPTDKPPAARSAPTSSTSDDHVAGWANDTATVDDKTLDVRAVVIFKMSDGKVTEAWHHFDDLTSLDNFLA